MNKYVKAAVRGIVDLKHFVVNHEAYLLTALDYFVLSRAKSHERQLRELNFNGKPFRFPSSFWFLHSIREIFVDSVYKFSAKTDSPLIIDCGANIGLSVIYFKMLFPQARLIAFEADPQIFDYLSKNVQTYGYNNLTLVKGAVWKEHATLTFFSEGSVGGRIISHNNSNNVSNGTVVSAFRLRDYLNESVDFLKLDIEGAEYEVLVDCADNLKNVNALFVEYHSKSGEQQRLNEILEIISKAGFRYYIKQAWDKVRHPFIDKKGKSFDLQLNIFCYRP